MRAYTSLEWCLNSPPKPHAFASLPLQSGLNIKLYRIIFLIVYMLLWLVFTSHPVYCTDNMTKEHLDALASFYEMQDNVEY